MVCITVLKNDTLVDLSPVSFLSRPPLCRDGQLNREEAAEKKLIQLVAWLAGGDGQRTGETPAEPVVTRDSQKRKECYLCHVLSPPVKKLKKCRRQTRSVSSVSRCPVSAARLDPSSSPSLLCQLLVRGRKAQLRLPTTHPRWITSLPR